MNKISKSNKVTRRRNKHLCKRLVINFIRNNPKATVTDIQNELRVNLNRLFGNISNAYRESGLSYPRARDYDKITRTIIQEIKENPLITVSELETKYNVNLYKIFRKNRSFSEIFKSISPNRHLKRGLRKRELIIDFIRKNPEATQWEINKKCKTKVQEIFDNGIREAFTLAKVDYPESQRLLYGIAKIPIRRRSMEFEKRISNLLKKLGNVDYQFKVPRGRIDAVWKINSESIPIEIKDYRTKPISKPEISQIKRYMKFLNSNLGLIVTNRGNLREFNLNSNKVIIVPANKLERYLTNLKGL